MARRRRLIWANPALEALDEIAAWIATDDSRAAAKLVRECLNKVERLERYPGSGRVLPELPGGRYREIIVAPCRIIYRRAGDDVLIVYVTRGERPVPLDLLE